MHQDILYSMDAEDKLHFHFVGDGILCMCYIQRNKTHIGTKNLHAWFRTQLLSYLFVMESVIEHRNVLKSFELFCSLQVLHAAMLIKTHQRKCLWHKGENIIVFKFFWSLSYRCKTFSQCICYSMCQLCKNCF